MDVSTLRALVEEALREDPPLAEASPAPEFGFQREIITLPQAPVRAERSIITLAQARENIRAAMQTYLTIPEPEHALLIKAAPGVGKTSAAVWAAEACAEEGRRVLYAGPRHEFYGDVTAIAERPEWWYEWLPRQKADDKIETCQHCEAISTWMARGYQGMDFCSRVCGWDYVNDECPYHAQKRRHEPLIFGQHQHVTLGHPLPFDVVIGDEYPMQAFCWQWRIPARFIVPRGMDLREPLTEVLHDLARLADNDTALAGPDLMTVLGGATRVREACEAFILPLDAMVLPPEIYGPGDVDDIPYAHLPQLVPLLAREARLAEQGKTYPHRIILTGGALMLLLRRHVAPKLPKHLIWMDATAEPRLYRAALQRDVEVVDAQPELRGRVYQVHDRANGKASLLDKEHKITAKAPQMAQQVEQVIERGGYKAPAIISYQGVIAQTPEFQRMPHTHYYAARGTNALEGCDVLIVAGTPQPPMPSIEKMAKMLFFERDEAFRTEWSARTQPYAYRALDGTGRGYPTGGFWGDEDMQAVLWAMREAEVIQAAHRARPVIHAVDVWLLTNLPLADLPPTELLSIRELFGAPVGVNSYLWPLVMQYAEWCNTEKGQVTASDLMTLGVSENTARSYIDRLVSEYGWTMVYAASKPSGGRRSVAAKGGEKAVK